MKEDTATLLSFAETGKSDASDAVLLAYYLGSSISGTGGGVVWSTEGWYGVVGLVLVLLGLSVVVVQVLVTMENKKPNLESPVQCNQHPEAIGKSVL